MPQPRAWGRAPQLPLITASPSPLPSAAGLREPDGLVEPVGKREKILIKKYIYIYIYKKKAFKEG